LDVFQREDEFWKRKAPVYKEFQVEQGIFFSALMNHGKDSDYVIHTEHLDIPIDYLGYRIERDVNVTVRGDVGEWVGNKMRRGSINVEGNTGRCLGHTLMGGSIAVKGNAANAVGFMMKDGNITVNGDAMDGVGCQLEDGEIVVNGNVGSNVGNNMKGGSITIIGNAEDEIGIYMRGGEIRLEGDYKALSTSFRRGRIYHKGKLIAGE
jgi:formylmethanofuran dehydrogenase subunit C